MDAIENLATPDDLEGIDWYINKWAQRFNRKGRAQPYPEP